MPGSYTHALVVDGTIRQLFGSDPNLPAPMKVIDVSGAPNVAENWQVSSGGKITPPAEPAVSPALVITYKADIYRRATDEEAEAIEMALAAAPVRQRRLFESAQFLDHSADEFTSMREAMVGMFGEARADELLAAS